MNIKPAKRKIKELIDTVNSMSPANEIKFHQQDEVTLRLMMDSSSKGRKL